MICDNCGTSNPDQSRFCSFCGQQIQPVTTNNDTISQSTPSHGPVVGMRPLFTKVPPPPQSEHPPAQPQINQATSQPILPQSPPQNNAVIGFRQIQGNTTSSPHPENSTLNTNPPTFHSTLDVNTPQQRNICPVCQNMNPAGAAFCGVCGNKVQNNAGTTTQQPGKVCSHCRVINNVNAKFCKNCGRLISPTTSRPSSTTKPRTMNNTSTTSNARNLWVGLAGLGAILTLICFFFPIQVIKMANPLAWITEGPENITFSMSGMQLLTLSSPTVKGLGEGLGDFTENAYNEMDMGQLSFNSSDPATQRSLTFNRILLGLLLCCSIATIIVTIQAYRTSETGISKLMIVLGGVSIVILIISTFIGNARFNTGNSDTDILLNSAIKFSNGLGFWGMLIGFASFGLGGFLRNQ